MTQKILLRILTVLVIVAASIAIAGMAVIALTAEYPDERDDTVYLKDTVWECHYDNENVDCVKVEE